KPQRACGRTKEVAEALEYGVELWVTRLDFALERGAEAEHDGEETVHLRQVRDLHQAVVPRLVRCRAALARVTTKVSHHMPIKKRRRTRNKERRAKNKERRRRANLNLVK